VSLLGMALVPEWFSIERSSTAEDTSAFDSVDMSTHRAICSNGASLMPSVRIAEEAATRPELQIVPLRSLAAAKAGSLEAYCEAPPLSGSGVSTVLGMTETSILRVRPNMSMAGLAKALHFVR